MISGIMPCSGWETTGYPWRLAISTWAKVCDEILIVTHGMTDIPVLQLFVDEFNKVDGPCRLAIRSVQNPPLTDFASYGSYLVYGVCLASDPDWILAIEADYMISPDQAGILRGSLLSAHPETEIVMANAVTLNYDGTKKLYNPDFKNSFPPHDGYTWDRPIGCRPRMGVLPQPFTGVDRWNVLANCEGFVRLRPRAWGQTFNSKHMNNNPHGFRILRTKVEFEHLSFTRGRAKLLKKLEYPYFGICGLDAKHVLAGDEPYPRRYPDLDAIAAIYADDAKRLLP